jgi:phosphoglycolate phosphatase
VTDDDAVVYDLDGTLVDLLVDWEAVAADVADVLGDAGVDARGVGLWEMLNLADEAGVRDAVEAAIAAHEREGARRSRRRSTADELADGGPPAAVCSLNCEAACRLALETHGLDDLVEAVVGRDSVDTRKPDPEPLLAALEPLGVPPERALFVGDSERDAEAARRAGTAFRWVDT